MKTRQNLLSIVEEMMNMYKPHLSTSPVDMTLAYSEKKSSVELVFESLGAAFNPLEKSLPADGSEPTGIRSKTRSIDYQRLNDRNRLTMLLS